MFTHRNTIESHIKATPITGSPLQMRAAFHQLAGPTQPYEIRSIGGVQCGVFGRGKPVVWFHGGGYVFGSSRSHANAAGYLALISEHQVIVPDYRLAPEHPWPAPLIDALSVCRALGDDIAVVGDSAGGHLALNLALQPDITLRALALISPNTDRTGRNMTRALNSGSDLMNDDADDRALARLAFRDLPDDDPQVSPILADLSSVPPCFLTAARNEVLYGDAVILHDLICATGGDIIFDEVDDIFHMWTLWPFATKHAMTTLHRISAHFRRTDYAGTERKSRSAVER